VRCHAGVRLDLSPRGMICGLRPVAASIISEVLPRTMLPPHSTVARAVLVARNVL
jgi:hypothetical protein